MCMCVCVSACVCVCIFDISGTGGRSPTLLSPISRAQPGMTSHDEDRGGRSVTGVQGGKEQKCNWGHGDSMNRNRSVTME